MQRIEPRKGIFARIVALGSRITYGRELELSQVYARHPRLMFDYMRANRAFERHRHVSKHLAELGVLRAATMVGCEFCVDIGSEYARRSGLSDEQLLSLHDAHGSGLFDPDELLVIDFATGMSRTPGRIDDELMQRVGERFGTKGALELIHLIAWENTRARANVALGMGAEGFSEGRVCALPNPEAASPQAAAA